MSPLALMKYAAIGCACVTLGLGMHALCLQPGAPLARAYRRYVKELERRLKLLFSVYSARQIVLAQALALLGALLAFVAWGEPRSLLVLPVAALAPYAGLRYAQRKRVQRLESKLDQFALALANALRAQPSIGSALAAILPGMPAPLDQELALVLRELRVGSTLEQALLGFGARADSAQLDVVLSGLLIGRKVGGNVPEIMENTASTLREMARLSGVLRAKTADGRIQAGLLAVFPVAVVFVFDALSPGYFDPLTDTGSGLVITALSAGCWIVSVLLARRILAVAL